MENRANLGFRIARFALGFLLAVATLELLAALSLRSHPPFYNPAPPPLDEINQELFSALDPNLGYAHFPGYRPSARDRDHLIGLREGMEDLRNGFVRMAFRAEEPKALRIAVLGSSSSDPYLFGGNWPYQLHRKFVREGTPHVIYNGAVSGYNSHQLLVKLGRDVFTLDRMDVVVVYHGGNDCPCNGDVIPGHPAIHPYQQMIFETMNGGSPAGPEPRFLPNLRSAARRLRSKWLSGRRPIQQGVRAGTPVGFFLKNVEYMELIASRNGSRLLFVPEPYLETEAQRAPRPHPFRESPELEKAMRLFLTDLHSRSSELKCARSVQAALPARPIFYDSVHVNEEGASRIAWAIAAHLRK